MRGKLRDKRSDARRYPLRREQMERRRPGKRESRTAILAGQQWEEENYLLGDDEGLQADAEELKK
jgi:hypothetical protein